MGTYDGAIQTAAKRVGLSTEEYIAQRAKGLKHCWGCRQWLPERVFGLDTRRGDGLATRCRECKNARARELHYPGKHADYRYQPRKVTP